MAVTTQSCGALCSDAGADRIVGEKMRVLKERTRCAVLSDAGYSGVLFSFRGTEEMSGTDCVSAVHGLVRCLRKIVQGF